VQPRNSPVALGRIGLSRGTNPLGIKAGGEGGTTAAPAVIVSGIVDPLRDYVRDIRMPATSYRVWKLIADAKAAADEEPVRHR
jgi:CO/xanthine dehydrogenase Mo-binding subunit